MKSGKFLIWKTGKEKLRPSKPIWKGKASMRGIAPFASTGTYEDATLFLGAWEEDAEILDRINKIYRIANQDKRRSFNMELRKRKGNISRGAAEKKVSNMHL